MRRGELAGIVHVVGKPNELFAKFKPEPGFHFLPVEYGAKFEDYYIPAELTSKDYPNLIPAGRVGADHLRAGPARRLQLEEDTDRYRRCVRFIEYLFDRFDKLQGADLPAGLEGKSIWPAPSPAGRAFRRRRRWSTGQRPRSASVDPGLARQQAARAAPTMSAEQERLFNQFLEWSKQQKRP